MTPVCAVVIPVYNHGQSLRQVVERSLKVHPLVIVVDDGSTDGGAATLADLPVRLVRLTPNHGKGKALQAGAAEAARAGADHMICLDADGQHYPEDIPLFLNAVAATPKAVIVGRRDFNTPHVPGSSRFGRAFSSFWMCVQTGVHVDDMQSGFRAYPLAVLQRVHPGEPGYAFEVEILVRAAWAGFEIREIDIRVYYPPPAERISHFRSVFDNLRISLLNTRLTIRALLPLPFDRQEDAVSLRHPWKSLRRLLASGTPPRELGKSAAAGMALSSLPLPGLQSLLLLYCVGRLGLNRVCALAMIPLTWPPVVPGLAVLLGYRLRNGQWLTEFSLQTLGYEAPQRLLDWMVGGFCLAPVLGLVAGALVWGLTAVIAGNSGRRRT